MPVTHEGKRNVYHQRLQKELGIPEEDVEARIRWDMPLLSSNHKCSVSLDLPILNCKATKACSEVCYASQGRQFYRGAIVKSLAVNRMILEEPERAARKMVDEAAGRAIRLAGSGEILPDHKTLLDYVEKYGGSCWGFTRRNASMIYKDLCVSNQNYSSTWRKRSTIQLIFSWIIPTIWKWIRRRRLC